jgi:flavin-binding protein dodecin
VKVRNTQMEPGALQMRRFVGITLAVALLAGSSSAALANPARQAGARSEDSVKTLALQWFAQMEAGQIDRAQLESRYSAQLTDDVVRAMSSQLKRYGASPTDAQVLRTRAIDDQTFYLVKLVFPRGDSAAMLVGFDTDGRITGIDFVSMAGD